MQAHAVPAMPALVPLLCGALHSWRLAGTSACSFHAAPTPPQTFYAMLTKASCSPGLLVECTDDVHRILVVGHPVHAVVAPAVVGRHGQHCEGGPTRVGGQLYVVCRRQAEGGTRW